MLTFLSPLFLVGLLSAAIPLVLHLSRSRRMKVMKFSTTRFFTDQFLRSYRMSRLNELWLLALRMALCALFAVALARPLWMPKGRALLPGGARSVVVVLDDSASMGYVEDGVPRIDRAKSAAKEVLQGLRPGDAAAVVLAGRRSSGPAVPFPQATTELGDVLQAVDSAKVETLGTDLSGAIARARQIARSSPAPSKEVYILSDLQESGWADDPTKGNSDGAEVSIVAVSLRPKSPRNLAITAVQYGAARPTVGVPFAIRPHISAQGAVSDACDVRLYVDGRKVGETRVTKLRDGRWAVPRFHHAFASGGWHSGYVEVADASLEADNRRYFAFEVLDAPRVLAVDGAPSAAPARDELFFLKAALTASPEGKSPVAVDVIGPAALAGTDLAKYPLVILANVARLPAPAVEGLEGYVDRGGSLLVFPGDQVDARSYDELLASPSRLHGGLLPGRLTGREGDPRGEADAATIAEVDTDHEALAPFAEPGFADLSAVRMRALWTIDAGRSDVLMKSGTGAPLLCEKPFGKGRVVLFAGPCDRDWSDFPVRPAFLPWVHRLVGYLALAPAGRQGFSRTGESIAPPASATEGLTQVRLRKPDGSFASLHGGDNPGAPAAFTETEQAGVYALLSDKSPDAARLLAVNLEAPESDLTYLDESLAGQATGPNDRAAAVEAGLKERLPGRPGVVYVDDPARVADLSRIARRGVRLWDVALWAVLGIALFEPWFANRISLRLYGRPRDQPPPAFARSGPSSDRTAGVREVSSR